MNSDLAYALLCQSTYTAIPDFQGIGQNSDIHAVRSGNVICFRGSKEPRDWMLDLLAVPALDVRAITNLRLGPIHAGFMVGADAIYKQISDAVTDKPYALCGHSLGGALALVTAGLLIAEGHPPPTEIVTFGAPRAGMLPLRFELRKTNVRQYRFGADIVPLVPTHPYVHVKEPLIQIGTAVRDASDVLMANHHIARYIEGLS